MLKSCGWWGGGVGWVVAHVIIVSAPVQKIGFGGFGDDLVRPLGPRDCWDGTWTWA